MISNIPDHPDIAAALVYGYPRKSYRLRTHRPECCECGNCVDDEWINVHGDVYCMDCVHAMTCNIEDLYEEE